MNKDKGKQKAEEEQDFHDEGNSFERLGQLLSIHVVRTNTGSLIRERQEKFSHGHETALIIKYLQLLYELSLERQKNPKNYYGIIEKFKLSEEEKEFYKVVKPYYLSYDNFLDQLTTDKIENHLERHINRLIKTQSGSFSKTLFELFPKASQKKEANASSPVSYYWNNSKRYLKKKLSTLDPIITDNIFDDICQYFADKRQFDVPQSWCSEGDYQERLNNFKLLMHFLSTLDKYSNSFSGISVALKTFLQHNKISTSGPTANDRYTDFIIAMQSINSCVLHYQFKHCNREKIEAIFESEHKAPEVAQDQQEQVTINLTLYCLVTFCSDAFHVQRFMNNPHINLDEKKICRSSLTVAAYADDIDRKHIEYLTWYETPEVSGRSLGDSNLEPPPTKLSVLIDFWYIHKTVALLEMMKTSDQYGNTLFHYIYASGNALNFLCLVRNFFSSERNDYFYDALMMQNQDGNTPLLLACSYYLRELHSNSRLHLHTTTANPQQSSSHFVFKDAQNKNSKPYMYIIVRETLKLFENVPTEYYQLLSQKNEKDNNTCFALILHNPYLCEKELYSTVIRHLLMPFLEYLTKTAKATLPHVENYQIADKVKIHDLRAIVGSLKSSLGVFMGSLGVLGALALDLITLGALAEEPQSYYTYPEYIPQTSSTVEITEFATVTAGKFTVKQAKDFADCAENNINMSLKRNLVALFSDLNQLLKPELLLHKILSAYQENQKSISEMQRPSQASASSSTLFQPAEGSKQLCEVSNIYNNMIMALNTYNEDKDYQSFKAKINQLHQEIEKRNLNKHLIDQVKQLSQLPEEILQRRLPEVMSDFKKFLPEHCNKGSSEYASEAAL